MKVTHPAGKKEKGASSEKKRTRGIDTSTCQTDLHSIKRVTPHVRTQQTSSGERNKKWLKKLVTRTGRNDIGVEKGEREAREKRKIKENIRWYRECNVEKNISAEKRKTKVRTSMTKSDNVDRDFHQGSVSGRN